MVQSGRNPFVPPPEDRDPARRLRGRLVAPVTVWTSANAGITVSSVMVAEGDPAEIIGLIGPLTDFWESLAETGRFVVHVLGDGQARLADQFAGRYPADPFEGVSFSASAYGRELTDVPVRARCRLAAGPAEAGYFVLVRGLIDSVELGAGGAPMASGAPLAGYHGRYVTVSDRRPVSTDPAHG